MKISEIQNILKADLLVGKVDALDLNIVGGGAADLMEDVLAAAAKDAVLLTGLISEEVIRTAKIAGVSVIVFVRGKKPPQEILDQAAAYSLPILLTDDSLFVACGRLYMNGVRGLDGSW